MAARRFTMEAARRCGMLRTSKRGISGSSCRICRPRLDASCDVVAIGLDDQVHGPRHKLFVVKINLPDGILLGEVAGLDAAHHADDRCRPLWSLGPSRFSRRSGRHAASICAPGIDRSPPPCHSPAYRHRQMLGRGAGGFPSPGSIRNRPSSNWVREEFRPVRGCSRRSR